MIRIAQKIENREDIRREANLPRYSGGRTTNPQNSTKTNTNVNTGENKGGMNWPMRTITLRGTSKEEVPKEGPTKRLSDAEFQARKEKGLCFRCNEKYSHDHKCKAKELRELRMLVVKEDNEEYEIIEDGNNALKELNTIEIMEEGQAIVELSMNSVVGLDNLGTMEVKGTIRGREIVVLIDCGATHNFVSERLVKELQLETKETSNYGVILGFGTAIKGKGICGAVELMLGDWKVIDEFLPLELGGVDAILNMQWLYSLGITE